MNDQTSPMIPGKMVHNVFDFFLLFQKLCSPVNVLIFKTIHQLEFLPLYALFSNFFFKAKTLASTLMKNPPDTLGCKFLGASLGAILPSGVCPVYLLLTMP